MAKRPTINNLSGGEIANAVNVNLQRIADAFENTVSRDGSTPNQMRGDFDLNGNDLLNVKDINVNGELRFKGQSIGQAIDSALAHAERSEVAADQAELSAEASLASAAQAAESADEAAAAAETVSAALAFESYDAALAAAPNVPNEVLVISADVSGTETRWVRDGAGTSLGGGWAPAGTAAVQNYGNPGAASLASAIAANPNASVLVDYDEQNLPADFAGVMLEYTERATARNINQSGFLPDQALRTLRTQTPSNHPDIKWSGLNLEVQARGSGKNGPFSADYGFTLNAAKLGYSSGSALSGEMDGLTIYLRQDGPDGFPSQDPGSSDAAAIMVNAQNIGTCGFVALSDQTVSNLRREAGFPVDLQMQTQHGVIDANNAAGKIAFGWVASMKTGVGRTAFHAAALEGAGWENLFDSPNLRATWAGELRFRSTADYADYGGRVLRPAGLNSQLSIENRGNLGIALRALDAGAITLATGGSNRWQLSSAGNWQPVTDLGSELGNAARRVANTHTNALVVYGNSLAAAGLPTYADNAAAVTGGLAVGRVYRTATGELRIVI